jgi:hypothetical protein
VRLDLFFFSNNARTVGVGGGQNYRLQDIQFVRAVLAPPLHGFFDIVWDDPDFARFASCVAAGLPRRSAEGAKEGTPGTTSLCFPVVIGEGSHPFPFRTRKLSPLPPMVLRA